MFYFLSIKCYSKDSILLLKQTELTMTTSEIVAKTNSEKSAPIEREASVKDLALAAAALELSAQNRRSPRNPIPKVGEWGPTHHRDDFITHEPATPEGLTYNI
jgi:hypothetical protein